MIFVTACGLALFGLIGVINLEVSFIIAFVIFAFATVFAWSYDGLAVRAGRQLEADWQRAATTQAVGAAPVLAGAVLAAYLIALALFTFVPNPFVATNLA